MALPFPRGLLVALVVRSLSLALPHTFFQPDEFYQAFEPAYAFVFGHGYLTWEWRDLPIPPGAPDTWWTRAVVGGRLRGWIWPGVFVLVYRLVQALGLTSTDVLVIAPRLIGVLLAAFTDYYTSLLAGKVVGQGYASGALYLSLASLFNAHLLTRALSTSPETLLTTMALYYYPLPQRIRAEPALSKEKLQETSSSAMQSARLTPGAMDAEEGHVQKTSVDNMVLAAALAGLSLCIRPTMLVFWAFLHLETSISCWAANGMAAMMMLTAKTLLGGASVLALSTALDWAIVGRVTLPTLSFFYQNVVLNIASFYGGTGLLYHVVQSLPLLLLPIWFWWAKGFAAAILPRALRPQPLNALDVTPGLRTLSRAVLATIATLSLSPHSEWRFLHPLLPQLLLFALPAMQKQYTPTLQGYQSIMGAVRQYCRMPVRAFYLVLLAPIIPYIYLNCFHGSAQVAVVSGLRHGDYGEVSSVVALMPCHSTPWASHLGDTPGWFLTCEPPLGQRSAARHRTQQDIFYRSPVSYIQQVFPCPPVTPDETWAHDSTCDMPSHILLFGEVLDRREPQDGFEISVGEALEQRGYHETARLWNGFDFAQDEDKRRGGVRVWVGGEHDQEGRARAHRNEL